MHYALKTSLNQPDFSQTCSLKSCLARLNWSVQHSTVVPCSSLWINRVNGVWWWVAINKIIMDKFLWISHWVGFQFTDVPVLKGKEWSLMNCCPHTLFVIFLVLKSCDVEVVESDRSDCFLSCQSWYEYQNRNFVNCIEKFWNKVMGSRGYPLKNWRAAEYLYVRQCTLDWTWRVFL